MPTYSEQLAPRTVHPATRPVAEDLMLTFPLRVRKNPQAVGYVVHSLSAWEVQS